MAVDAQSEGSLLGVIGDEVLMSRPPPLPPLAPLPICRSLCCHLRSPLACATREVMLRRQHQARAGARCLPCCARQFPAPNVALKLCAQCLYHTAWQDTVTGFLLAGVGNVDLRRKTNYLVVNESAHLPARLAPARLRCTAHVMPGGLDA